MKTAVVIPAYNEKLTIRDALVDCHSVFPDAQLVVVDNNSTDGTGDLARSTLAALGCDGVVFMEKQQGKANAVRKAFHAIDADIYIMLDADLTYPAKEVKKLIEPILKGSADMVVGDRISGGHYERENKRLFHNFGNQLIAFLLNLLFHADLHDIMSGARVFSRAFVKNYPIMCSGFEIETEMTLHALDKRFAIVEVPIVYKDRPAGSFSKLNTVGDGIRVIKTIFSLFKDYKPLVFFGGSAILFFLLGLASGMLPILEFVRFHYVYRVPLTILATGLMLVSLLCLTAGFILDTVVNFHRQTYELQLLRFPK